MVIIEPYNLVKFRETTSKCTVHLMILHYVQKIKQNLNTPQKCLLYCKFNRN